MPIAMERTALAEALALESGPPRALGEAVLPVEDPVDLVGRADEAEAEAMVADTARSAPHANAVARRPSASISALLELDEASLVVLELGIDERDRAARRPSTGAPLEASA